MNRHRRREAGQVLPIFALMLLLLIVAAGLLIDGGFGWSNRRVAQAAADTAAMAAVGAASNSGSPTTAAESVAAANGFDTSYVDCGGITQSDGVVVNNPPLSGKHTADVDPNADNYIEVIVTRPQQNFFSQLAGQGCWLVSARAVAEMAVTAAASCSFCALNGSTDNHTLLLQNGATLRVDGDIYVNSLNHAGAPAPSCNILKNGWNVCGDGFDIFGDPVSPPAYISAKTISVSGGWETHDENVVMADSATWPDYTTNPPTYMACPAGAPQPTAQTQTANVCIHVPQIVDPLNNPSFPASQIDAPAIADYTVPTSTNCATGTRFPSTDPANKTPLAITGNATICPGIYYGGVSITSGITTMLPGLYYIVSHAGDKKSTSGFIVAGTGGLDGTAGVTIYNGSANKSTAVNILPSPDLADDIFANGFNQVAKLTSNVKNNQVKEGKGGTYPAVTFTFEIGKAKGGEGPVINGTIDFYDGDTKISGPVGSSRVDLQACKLEYSIVSPK